MLIGLLAGLVGLLMPSVQPDVNVLTLPLMEKPMSPLISGVTDIK